MHRRSPRDAQETRRLDASRQRGRTEDRDGGNRGGLGPVIQEPCPWLVRLEERSSRKVCYVRAAINGSTRKSRARAQRQEQPNARSLASCRPSAGPLSSRPLCAKEAWRFLAGWKSLPGKA